MSPVPPVPPEEVSPPESAPWNSPGEYLFTQAFDRLADLSQYPIWVAADGVENAGPLPKGWTAWTLWQHSDDGKVDGITGDVDLDVFNGTIAGLKAFAVPTT